MKQMTGNEITNLLPALVDLGVEAIEICVIHITIEALEGMASDLKRSMKTYQATGLKQFSVYTNCKASAGWRTYVSIS